MHCHYFSGMQEQETGIYRRWVAFCTAGELLGFGGIPVIGGITVVLLTSGLDTGTRALLLYAVAVVGGAGEGAVLGWFQLRVLEALLPRLDGQHWLLATASAAAAAWALGMLPSTLDDLFSIATWLQVAIWIPAAVLILISIGAAQSMVLRGVVSNPGSWLVANVLGWLAGLPWTFLLPALLPESAPVAVWIATFAVAGVLMGLTVGLVTGLALLRLRPLRA